MSNTIKIIANKKNRIEKGIRAVWFGSNPHSKDESFSRGVCVGREDKIQAIAYTNTGRIIAVILEIKRFIIN